MNSVDKLRAIAGVLKKRFTNLTVDETLQIAADILSALERDSGTRDRE